VIMKPAAPGTGVIAGGAVRDILQAAGIKDVRTKALKSRNPQNLAHATIVGLKSLRTLNEVAQTRGKNVQDILG